MLEMGEPVRILDLAQRMIRLSGRRVGTDIEIRVTAIARARSSRRSCTRPRRTRSPPGTPRSPGWSRQS